MGNLNFRKVRRTHWTSREAVYDLAWATGNPIVRSDGDGFEAIVVEGVEWRCEVDAEDVAS